MCLWYAELKLVHAICISDIFLLTFISCLPLPCIVLHTCTIFGTSFINIVTESSKFSEIQKKKKRKKERKKFNDSNKPLVLLYSFQRFFFMRGDQVIDCQLIRSMPFISI